MPLLSFTAQVDMARIVVGEAGDMMNSSEDGTFSPTLSFIHLEKHSLQWWSRAATVVVVVALLVVLSQVHNSS